VKNHISNQNFLHRSNLHSFLLVLLLSLTMITGCASNEKHSSTGEFIDDSAITAKVKTKLLDDELVRGTAISVETLKGTVLLSGFAKSRQEIAQAESIAKRVHGVREVRNQIVLRP